MRRFHRALPVALAFAFVPLLGGCAAGEPVDGELPDVPGMFQLSSSSAAVQAEIVRAHHALNMSRQADAYDHAQTAIELDPLYGYAYLVAAWAAPSFSDFRSHLRRAIENSATTNDPERALIEATQKGFDADPEGALEIEERLLASDESNPLFHLLVARRLAGLNRTEEARAAARRALELAPDYGGALTWLGVNLTTRQPTDYGEAERLLRRAIELLPDEPFPHDYLADLHRVQGRLAEAVEGYTRAMEMDTSRASSFLGQRGHSYSFMGDYPAARRDYQSAAEKSVTDEEGGGPNWWTRQAGYTYIYEGDIEAALAELDRALAIAEASTGARAADDRIVTLWEIFLLNGHARRVAAAEEAVRRLEPLARARAAEVGTEEFSKLVERNIANAEGWLALWRGDYAETRARAREAMRIVAEMPDPRRYETAHELMGHADLAEQRYAQAVGHFEQANPNDLYVLYYHALALEGAGRTDEARALFQRVADYRFSNLTTALVKPLAQQRLAQAS